MTTPQPTDSQSAAQELYDATSALVLAYRGAMKRGDVHYAQLYTAFQRLVQARDGARRFCGVIHTDAPKWWMI
jgi:hypothetical protein